MGKTVKVTQKNLEGTKITKRDKRRANKTISKLLLKKIGADLRDKLDIHIKERK